MFFTFCRFCKEAQTHEQQRLRENLDLILSRCDSLHDCKSKLESDFQHSTSQHQFLERELNLIKPDLLKLYRRRDQIQRALIKQGFNVEVQKVIEETRFTDENDNNDENNKFQQQNNFTSEENGQQQKSKTNDYIPPDGAFENVKDYLLEGYSKQDAMNMLLSKRDGTFLIRASETRPGYFALSLTCKNRVHSCLIECRNGKYGFAGTDALFGSIVEFVQHYSYTSLKGHNPELDTTLRHPVLLEQNEGTSSQY